MMTVKVVPDDGAAYNVTIKTRDFIAWERATGKSFKDATGPDGEMEMSFGELYALVYAAASRQKLFTGTLEEFEAANDVEFDNEDEEVTEAPLRAGRKAR